MHLDRRDALRLLRGAVFAGSSSLILNACASLGSGGGKSLRVAGLLPLSGSAAAVGRSMSQAVQLAQPQGFADGFIFILDTLGTQSGAGAAATAAVQKGAQLIFGPVFSAELPAAIAAANGQAPIVAFTNDPTMLGRGAFLLGITPMQSVSAILSFAASQNFRRISIIAKTSRWGDGVAEAARLVAPKAQIELTGVLKHESGSDPAGLAAALKAASGGKLPDAVLLADGMSQAVELAPALKAAQIQLLGTVQWSGADFSQSAAMQGAWYAAPDPSGFAQFAIAYGQTFGEPPGLLAGLAFDAALLAGAIERAGGGARDVLLAASGFSGVTGAFRFNADGACVRQLAILLVEPGGIRVVAPVTA